MTSPLDNASEPPAADSAEQPGEAEADASAAERVGEPSASVNGDGSEERAPGETYRVELENFEGPLDLLLHLIQQHELDIMDIPIAFITERYVAYVMLMRELNIDVASEYLVMAATLTHIKSKMLLPSVPDDQEDGDLEPEGDPRQELVRRLLEYQKYKDAAEKLGARDVFGRDVYARGMSAPEIEGPAPLADIPMFRLLDAFQSVLDRVQKSLDHEIELDRLSITERINELVDHLKGIRRCKFEDLFEGQRTRADMIITFLALLEMTRLRMMRLTQETPLAPIEIESCLEDDSQPEPTPEPEPASEANGVQPAGRSLRSDTDRAKRGSADRRSEPAAAEPDSAAVAEAEPNPEPALDPESVSASQADPTTTPREGRASEDESGGLGRGASADEKDH